MSEDDIREFEDEGEAEPEGGLVTKNPIGEYYGARNDKNERHGRGRAALPNGDIYLGCYYRGQRHGLGVYRYKNGNGARYGGDWVFGEKQGWGTFYFPDGSQYTGNWDRGIRHGWGVYVYPNGDEYEGWWYRGKRNGRGIYRTKKTNEKFVGHWVLGQRQGQGMLIRKNHRFIGNWYNDIPKGPGVYIFPKLRVEQHGKYTLVKIPQEAEEKWKNQGYQVRQIRSAPPPKDPVELENEKNAPTDMLGQDVLAEDYGESAMYNDDGTTALYRNKTDSRRGSAPEPGIMANPEDVTDYMRNIMSAAADADEDKIPVVPVWRAIQITGLVTEIPDETVPPPPMPPTPQPPVEKELEEEANKSAEKEDDGDDPISLSKSLARTHKLGPTYLGDGVCQPSAVDIRFPDENKLQATYSSMSLSEIDEFRMALQAMIGQLEPLDLKAVMAANANLFKSKGMEMTEPWRPCLADDETCANPEMPLPPGQHAIDDTNPQEQAQMSQKQSALDSEMNAAEQPRKTSFGKPGDPSGSMIAPPMPQLPAAAQYGNISAGGVPQPVPMEPVYGQPAVNVPPPPQYQQQRLSADVTQFGEFKPMEQDAGASQYAPQQPDTSVGAAIDGQRRTSQDQDQGQRRLSQNQDQGQRRTSQDQDQGQRRLSQNQDQGQRKLSQNQDQGQRKLSQNPDQGQRRVSQNPDPQTGTSAQEAEQPPTGPNEPTIGTTRKSI